MTSFVHLDYSNQHAGVARVESAIASAQQIKRNFSGTRSLATLLLSAIAAAVMVAAHQVMNSMADGHLLVLWIGMWAAAFAALAAFAGTAKVLAASLKTSLDSWSRRVAVRRADERLWAMAQTDSRVMSDLQAAMAKHDVRDEHLTFVSPSFVPVNKPKAVVAKTLHSPAYQALYI